MNNSIFRTHIINYSKLKNKSFNDTTIILINDLITEKTDLLNEKVFQVYIGAIESLKIKTGNSGSEIVSKLMHLETALIFISASISIMERLDKNEIQVLTDRIIRTEENWTKLHDLKADMDSISLKIIDNLYTNLKSLIRYNRFELPKLLKAITIFRRTKAYNKKDFTEHILSAISIMPGINKPEVAKTIKLFKKEC